MSFVLNNADRIVSLILEHLSITIQALGAAALIALPLGFFIHRNKRVAGAVLGVLGAIYSIPSIALMVLLIPLFGLSPRAVIVALVLYAQVILVRNVIAGLDAIDPAVLDVARGMGMNPIQIGLRVELPLALPVILAGARIAGIVIIATATIGAKFGAGGLGTLLFEGIAQSGRYDKIWVGGILVSLLALGLSGLLLYVERRLRPESYLRA